MQDGPDVKLNRIMSTPVNSQFDPLLGAAFRAAQGQPGERLSTHDHRHLVPGGFKRGDDGGCQFGKLAAALPAGE